MNIIDLINVFLVIDHLILLIIIISIGIELITDNDKKGENYD